MTSDKNGTVATSIRSLLPRRVGVAIGLAAVAAIGFVFTRNLIDFPVYYAAGQSLLSGRADLYAPDFARGPVMDYRYPPFFLVILIPLWLLPYPVAAYLWYLFSILEIAGCVWVVQRLAGGPAMPLKVKVVCALIVAQYFVMVLHYGNAHLLAVFLMFAASYLVLKQKDFSAALLMALSITIKLFPLFLLPYFALRRKWRFLSVVCLLVVALNLTPALFFGFARNAELLKAWYAHVIAEQEFHEANGPINLSLKGGLRRYLTAVDYSQRVDGDTRYPSVSLIAVTPQHADRMWLMLSAMTILFVMAFIWWRAQRIDDAAKRLPDSDSAEQKTDRGMNALEGAMALEVGLMICLMLLVGPLTSKIYFIALLWPVASLAGLAFRSESPAARFAKYALVVVAITNSVLPLLPGRLAQRALLVFGVDLLINLLLTVAVGLVLFSRPRLPRSGSGAPQKEALSEAKTS